MYYSKEEWWSNVNDFTCCLAKVYQKEFQDLLDLYS